MCKLLLCLEQGMEIKLLNKMNWFSIAIDPFFYISATFKVSHFSKLSENCLFFFSLYTCSFTLL